MMRMRVLLFAVILSGASICPGQDFSCKQTQTTVQWRIDRPNVKRAITEYKNIVFHAGDEVRINAGGCVQSGGSGKTWKRYKNPIPSNKYYGTIGIPDVLPLQPLRDVNNSVKIPSDVAETHLVLGYVDDVYSDNGYWSPDSGNPVQCTAQGDAFVEITIQQSQLFDACPKSLPKPFDVVEGEGTDVNGFPINPLWGSQLASTANEPPDADVCHYAGGDSFDPKCTNVSTTINAPVFLHKQVCERTTSPAHDKPRAHFNWEPATFIAPVFWSDHQDSTFKDDDIDLWITPPRAAGVTAGNETKINGNTAIEVEFRMQETLRRFIRGAVPAWDEIIDAIDQEDNSQGGDPNGPPAKFNNKCAVVIGVLGLDCDHGCKSELHPAYVLALHVHDDPADDTWLIFARNTGNEGYCSSKFVNLPLPSNRLSVLIPRPGAQFQKVLETSQFFSTLNNSTVQVEISPVNTNSPAAVIFEFPAQTPVTPEQAELIFGELHLQWNNAGTITIGDHACVTSPSVSTLIQTAESEETDGLDKLGITAKDKVRNQDLLLMHDSNQNLLLMHERELQLQQGLLVATPAPQPTPLIARKPLQIKVLATPPVKRSALRLQNVADPNQVAKQAVERASLCAGFAPKNAPAICKQDVANATTKAATQKH